MILNNFQKKFGPDSDPDLHFFADLGGRGKKIEIFLSSFHVSDDSEQLSKKMLARIRIRIRIFFADPDADRAKHVDLDPDPKH